MLSDTLEDIDEIGVNIDTVEPTSHDQALHDPDVFRAQLGPTEIPIFSAHRDGAQRTLQMVGIQWHIGVGEKDLQT
jgi:hypothetical protein